MFKKLLSSVGIGAAKVDLRLESDRLQPGGAFKGQIVCSGGEVEQKIEGLRVALMTRAEVESGDNEHEQNFALATWRIPEQFTLAPKETRTLEFDGTISEETPLTVLPCRNNRTRVWLQTGLDIDMAIDPSDRDVLYVEPTPAQAAFLQAMEQAGFVMRRADVEKGYLQGRGFRSKSGCYQEIEFTPAGMGRWSIKEAEVSFVPEGNRTHVLIEIDRTFRGDGYISLTLDHGSVDVGQIAGELERVLR